MASWNLGVVKNSMKFANEKPPSSVNASPTSRSCGSTIVEASSRSSPSATRSQTPGRRLARRLTGTGAGGASVSSSGSTRSRRSLLGMVAPFPAGPTRRVDPASGMDYLALASFSSKRASTASLSVAKTLGSGAARFSSSAAGSPAGGATSVRAERRPTSSTMSCCASFDMR